MKPKQIKDKAPEQVFTECTVVSYEPIWVKANPILFKNGSFEPGGIVNLSGVRLDINILDWYLDENGIWRF